MPLGNPIGSRACRLQPGRSGGRALVLALLALGGVATPASVGASRGGPDSHGYTWRDDREPGVAYQRFDFLPPPTDVFVAEPGPDASTAFLPLPFAFPFYGRDYTALSVSEDGWVSFEDEFASDATPTPVPDPDGPRAMIAPLWADLSLGAAGRGDWLRHQGDGTRFVLEWFRARVEATDEDATFQLWLFPDGRLRFQYLNVSGPHPGATIGIEAADLSSGLAMMTAGVGTDGFEVRPRSAVEILPPSDADCSRAVGCRDRVSATVRRNPDDMTSYPGCLAGTHPAAEVVRTVRLAEVTHLSAVLTAGATTNDVFLLPGCVETACLAGGGTASADFLPPGDYVLAVDSRDAATAEAFELSVSCEPAFVRSECGARRGSLGGPSRISSWPCLPGDATAGEASFHVSLAAGGDLVASVDRPDLLVVISGLRGFAASGGTCISAGLGRTWATDLPAGDYVVSVDGPAGSAPDFELELACSPGRTLPLACGDVVEGTLPPAGELAGWSCAGPGDGGGEELFELVLDTLATLTITADGDEDVDLLLLDGRREGPAACLARGTGFLSVPNAPPGPYVIVAESLAGASYRLAVACDEPVGSACTPWERHDGDVPVTGLDAFVQHGQPDMYDLATPPPPDDPGWRPAPDPTTIGYAQGSAICGHACLTALDFTYFRTFVRLPQVVTTFEVRFATVDDGVEVRLNGVPAGIGFLGGGVTVDLTTSPALRPGELNEVLLVQVDDCCSWTELSGAACVVLGQDPPCEAWVDAGEDVVACPGAPVELRAEAELTNCFDVVEYRWLRDGVVLRDWSPDPRFFHVAETAPAQVTAEARCRRDVTCVATDALRVAAPGDPVLPLVSPHLRVSRDPPEVVLAWPAAAVPAFEGHFHVWRSPRDVGPFALRDHGAVAGATWRDRAPAGRLLLYDVRSADGCERESAD